MTSNAKYQKERAKEMAEKVHLAVKRSIEEMNFEPTKEIIALTEYDYNLAIQLYPHIKVTKGF